MTVRLFGVYLLATSMRAINSSSVKSLTDAGIMRPELKAGFDKHAQGHTSRMALRLYTNISEKEKARNIVKVNDLLNEECSNCECDYSSSDESSENDDSDDNVDNSADSAANKRSFNASDSLFMSPKKRMKHDAECFTDWGVDHILFGKTSGKIRWTTYEKNYIKQFVDEHSDVFDKFDQCLKSIWQADADVRRQFHINHIENSSALRDAIRVRK
jgi:hypothetical protein